MPQLSLLTCSGHLRLKSDPVSFRSGMMVPVSFRSGMMVAAAWDYPKLVCHLCITASVS